MSNAKKWLLGISLNIMSLGLASAAPLAEPPAGTSSFGVLNLLMVAKPVKLTGLTTPGYAPTGWAYEICYRPPGNPTSCPAGTSVSPWGGARFQVNPGDVLKIRLVNQLPPVDPANLDRIVDDPLLKLNPTNLHTHGLIVDATANTSIPPAVPVYGDFVYTSVFNPANGDPALVDKPAYDMLHAHGDVVKNGIVDYVIPIPANHPPGAFWIHPHMHGNAVNQIAAGLSGIVTVGSVPYICGDLGCTRPVPAYLVRHLILKDMQVLAGPNGGTMQSQVDSAFCLPAAKPGDAPRNGFCPVDTTANPKYANGGNWFFTVNGQQFPTVSQVGPDGEVWRIQNAAASGTYDLVLENDKTKNNMVMQLISMDGITVNVPPGTAAGDIVKLGGGRFRYANCPARPATNASTALTTVATTPGAQLPICVTELFMMPSSRAEIWVSYRDPAGYLVPAPAGSTATLKAKAYSTGPIGDTWPEVNLAKVQFFAGGTRNITVDFLKSSGDALRTRQPGGIFASRNPAPTAAVPPNCKALPAGHRRRVYFGNPGTGNDAAGNPIFGLGYEQIDQNGVPVPGTFVDISRFDPARELCIPLAKGNMPANEVWELINLTGELHNFHIHQTKFKVVSATAPSGSVLAPNSTVGDGIEEDNIPLPFVQTVGNFPLPDSGSCSVADFKAGRCKATPILVSIPFVKLGRFVYHCHILEHEDGGMMQAIRVVPGPQ